MQEVTFFFEHFAILSQLSSQTSHQCKVFFLHVGFELLDVSSIMGCPMVSSSCSACTLSSQNPKHSCAGQQYLWSNAVPTAQVRPCDGALVLGFASIPFSRKLCWDMLGIVGRFVGILETLRLIQIAYVFHDVPIRSM